MTEATKTKPAAKSGDSPEAADAGSAQAQQPARIGVDDKSISAASYANFCRVTGAPEELIIDFGLNSQPFGTPTDPVHITQRIVTNDFTAKRMLHALYLSVQRHE